MDASEAGRSGKPAEAADLVAEFEEEIARQEDLLYGVALFFEGLQFLYAGQAAIITTYRKQLRNIIQMDRMAIEQARSLLEQARRDPSRIALLTEFRFMPCHGHPRPEELSRRARLLVDSYNRCFPDRPRSEPLCGEEIVKLLDHAAEKIELKPF